MHLHTIRTPHIQEYSHRNDQTQHQCIFLYVHMDLVNTHRCFHNNQVLSSLVDKLSNVHLDSSKRNNAKEISMFWLNKKDKLSLGNVSCFWICKGLYKYGTHPHQLYTGPLCILADSCKWSYPLQHWYSCLHYNKAACDDRASSLNTINN